MVARHLLGEFDGRERLQQREQRAAEQSRLLAGHDRDRFGVGQPLRGVTRGRRRVSTLLLIRKERRHIVAPPNVRLGATDGFGPGRRFARVAGKKRRDRLKVEGIVGGKPPDPREAPLIDGDARGVVVYRIGNR